MRDIHITCVAGARPNFVKVAALFHEIRTRPRFRAQLVHTGQHYSHNMSQSFFDELGIPEPDCNLGAGGSTQTQQTAEIMQRIEPVLLARRPDLLVVVGDVNSTVAASLVAAKLGIAIAHIEAGLRSHDRSMPEEINRLVTDAISDYLFVSEPSGAENLLREGVNPERIFFVGNVMIDTLLRFRMKAASSGILTDLGLKPHSYGVLTLHRPSNVDDIESLFQLLEMLDELGSRIRIVFPVHPRTQEKLKGLGRTLRNIIMTPPQPYLDFVRLLSDARLVLTDSGGIQEETTVLQVRCLTLRKNTERPVTITEGTNTLVGTVPEPIRAAVCRALDEALPAARIPQLWDGFAARRIFDVLERVTGGATEFPLINSSPARTEVQAGPITTA